MYQDEAGFFETTTSAWRKVALTGKAAGQGKCKLEVSPTVDATGQGKLEFGNAVV